MESINWDEVCRIISENKELKQKIDKLERENERLRREIRQWVEDIRKLGRE